MSAPAARPLVSRDAALPDLATEHRLLFAWVSMVCGFVWALHLLYASHGVQHPDALTHFLFSREAWYRPSVILNHWGRPVDTLIYMIPARFELVYARVASLILTALTVLVTFRLAQQLRVGYAFVVPALLWFQPWFLTWGVHPSMTEIPFSLMLALSAFLFVSNRTVLASAVIGLLPLTRVEALALTALWVVVCAWRKEWLGVVIASLPILVYGALHRIVFGALPEGYLPLESLWSTHHATYHQAWRIYHWLSYPKLLAFGAGLPLAALALYGAPRLFASPSRLAVLAWYGTYGALHVALLRLGMEGWAEDRYWLPLAPVVSIAGALGLEALVSRIRTRLPERGGARVASARLGTLGVPLAVGAIIVNGLFVSPVQSGMEDAARATVAWLRQERLTDRPILSSPLNLWFHYFMVDHIAPHMAPPDDTWNSKAIQRLEEWHSEFSDTDWPRGSIAVWDSGYSDNAGLPWRALSSNHKWKVLKTFEVGDSHMVVLQKQAQ